MLGVVAERFPKGGAMTLNTIAGVGMLSVGIGRRAVFLGYIQDNTIDKQLRVYDVQQSTKIHDTYVVDEKDSFFGKYMALDAELLAAAPEADKAAVQQVTNAAKKSALKTVALFPCVMLVCYLILIAYFRTQGGYKALHLDEARH
jgi:hypothetical protein